MRPVWLCMAPRAKSAGRSGGDGLSVLLSPIASTWTPPMPSGCGDGVRTVCLGQHGDSVTCGANQVYPRQRGSEHSFTAEGAMVIELGGGGLGWMIHGEEITTR